MARRQAFTETDTTATYHTPTIEDYVQGVWILASRGERVIGARLAEWLNVKPPTVTATLQRMIRNGLITMDEHKQVHLSPAGETLAEDLVRRHRVLERFLTDVLGLRWYEVHAEAHRMEHAISPLVEERMMVLMGRPATCPHGNPIPREPQPERRPSLPLSKLEPGQRGRIQRIAEEAEDDLELMAYLEEHRLVPGTQLERLQQAGAASIGVQVVQTQLLLDQPTANAIYVEPAAGDLS